MYSLKQILNELSMFDKALEFSLDTHQGQYRRFSQLPYSLHTIRTMKNVRDFGGDINQQIIALLHDTIEDSKNKKETLDKIKDEFPAKIANAVLLLTKERGINYINYISKLAKKSNDVFMIKLSDMLDNLRDNPSSKQFQKYKEAVLFLMKQGYKIPHQLKSILEI